MIYSRVSNNLIQNVGHDLGSNCLQSLSTGNKSHLQSKSQQTKDNNKSMKKYILCKKNSLDNIVFFFC